MMRHLTKEEKELLKKYDDPKTSDEEKLEIIKKLNKIDDENDLPFCE